MNIRATWQHLADRAPQYGDRAEQYRFDILQCALNKDQTGFEITPEDYHRILLKYTQPIPRENWPLALRAIAHLATPSDTGIGDLIHRLAGTPGILYEHAHKALLKTDCGCVHRRALWNLQYPLP